LSIDENSEREALTDFETTKARLAEIRQTEAKLKTVSVSTRDNNSKPSKRGRKAFRPS